MGSSKDQVVCNLKPARKSKGLSQTELAVRIGVKRQAVYDMETGRYVPNTALALKMAKELGCKVEDLFSLDDSEEEQPVTLLEKTGMASARVSVARVRERLIAYPLDGKWLLGEGFQAADGLLSPDCGRVRLFQGREDLEKKIFLFGCDPAFAILSAHVARAAPDVKLLCRFASSRRALESLAAGHTHIAGTHLHNPGPEESNILMAKQILPGTEISVVGFSLFEEGLMVFPGNPHGIRSVVDLARENVKIVNREAGAALRTLLDDCLARAGVPVARIGGYEHHVSGHVEGAQMVRYGLADAALGLRAVAVAHGLDFVPIEAVRCDLVIPHDLMDHVVVKVVLDVLQSRALRGELASLPGYESSSTGKVIN